MKTILRKLFRPLLNHLETGQGEYNYKPSHRLILTVVSGLCLFLSLISASVAIYASQLAGILPCLIFFSIGLVSLVVSLVGTDRAVAKIWGNK